MSLGHYEVRETIVAARPVAGVRAQVPRGRVAQEFGRHLDQVYAAARAGAVVLDGQNIFIYREATDEQLTVDFCVGVTARFAAVGVVSGGVGRAPRSPWARSWPPGPTALNRHCAARAV